MCHLEMNSVLFPECTLFLSLIPKHTSSLGMVEKLGSKTRIVKIVTCFPSSPPEPVRLRALLRPARRCPATCSKLLTNFRDKNAKFTKVSIWSRTLFCFIIRCPGASVSPKVDGR